MVMDSNDKFKPGTVVVAHLHSGDSITGTFASSLDDLLRFDERVMFPPIRNQCNADIAAGRKQATDAFLRHSTGEWMLFLDDDMGFGPDIVAKLLEHADPVTAPVMGALCFTYRRYEVSEEKSHRMIVRPTIYRLIETSNDIGYSAVAEYDKDTVTEVDGTGAACLLIHRNVFEIMNASELDWMRNDQWWEPIVIPKGRDAAGTTRLSEDLSFCFRCKLAGIPIHVNTAAKTSHRKPIYLDEWYFENQPQRVIEPELAIIGTGRSGSQFVAEALSAVGVSCGHEAWWNTFGTRSPGLRGDSSWVATAHMEDYGGKVWHQVRHPLAVINSLIGNELFESDAPPWVAPFEEERRRQAGYDVNDPAVVKAMRIVAHYWEAAEKYAERTWRVEDFTAGLLVELADEMGRQVPLAFARQILDKLGTETNKHPDLGEKYTWDELPDNDDKALIAEMAARFGYDLGEEVGAGPNVEVASR